MRHKTQSVLSVQGVTKRFDGLGAVSKMSFHVAAQEMVGVIGPNGSGKTTMMNLISGVYTPSEGGISLHGRQISNLPPQHICREGIGRTFQLVRLLPGLTVLENVKAGAVFGHKRRWGRDADQFALEMLERVGLEGQSHAPISTLTYIDQKRVELARVLAGEPEVLLLDECFAALDVLTIKMLQEIIVNLQKESNITICICDHQARDLLACVDKAMILSNCKIVAEGSPQELVNNIDAKSAYFGDSFNYK